jgi:hypothetical protein
MAIRPLRAVQAIFASIPRCTRSTPRRRFATQCPTRRHDVECSGTGRTDGYGIRRHELPVVSGRLELFDRALRTDLEHPEDTSKHRRGTDHAGGALTGTVQGPAFRANIGIQGTFGVSRGDVSEQRGATREMNFSLPLVNVTISTTPSGDYSGFFVSYGPAVGVGFSPQSESCTAVITGRDFLNKIGYNQ